MALVVELVSMPGARRAQPIEAVRVWSSASQPLASIFLISSLLILCAVLALTLEVWGWSHAWIDHSLAISILLSVMGARVNGTHAKRTAERAAALAQGPIPSDLRTALNDPILWASAMRMMSLALGIVFGR
jgi:hypothetical protein